MELLPESHRLRIPMYPSGVIKRDLPRVGITASITRLKMWSDKEISENTLDF